MNDARNRPSPLGILISCLLGFALVCFAVVSAVRQEFQMKLHGSTTPVTPDAHPATFWGWLAFWFALGILAFIRGYAQFRAYRRQRKEKQRS